MAFSKMLPPNLAFSAMAQANGIDTVSVAKANGIEKSGVTSNGLLTNLISYWALDEASGNAIDSHGSNDLTETGGTIGSTTGIITNARDFEAADTEWFEIAENASLSTGDIDFSFSFWFKPENVGVRHVICMKSDGSNLEYNIRVAEWTNCFDIRVSKDATGFAGLANFSSSVAMSAGNWYHCVIWHDSVNNQIGLTVNDQATPDVSSYSLGVADTNSPLLVGADQFGEYMDGLLCEFGFWKRVLSSDDITALYNAGAGLAYSSFTS